MSKRIVAYFSESGVPKTGLSPVITILDLETDTVVVDAQAMTEKSLDGFYEYIFTTYDVTKEYAIMCDGISSSLDSRYQPAINDFVSLEEIVNAIDGYQLDF